MKRRDLEDQILALLDGDLCAEEVADLENVLRTDPSALETYKELVALHNALETRFAGESSLNLEFPAQHKPKAAPLRKRRRLNPLFATAAIILGLTVLIAAILFSEKPQAVASFQTAPDSNYLLSYDGKAGKGAGDRYLAVGARLQLSEGAIEAVFTSGVRLVAEAPCALRILADNRVGIDQGATWFQVPEAGRGFVAETSGLVVVDLGTEFGVIASADKPSEVHCLKGVVEAHAPGNQAAKQTLTAGMARQSTTDGTLAEIEAAPSLFRTRLDYFSGAIANFTFTGPPWSAAKEDDFATFAAKAPSEDADPYSTTSVLKNSGYNSGGHFSFLMRDIDTEGAAFSTSATPGVGMNLGGGNQKVPTLFVAFSVKPNSGYETTFESLSFYTNTYAPNDEYFVELRIWDGRKEVSLGTISHMTGPLFDDPVVYKSIDFADFTSSAPIEFRLYGYGIDENPKALYFRGIRFDDIILKGRSGPAR